MKRFALVLLLAAPVFAQSDKLTLNFDYPPAALDPTMPVVFRVFHSPLITVGLTNWPVIATSTNSTNFLIPKVPGFNNIVATASNALNHSEYSTIKSYFVPIPPGTPRIGVPTGPSASLRNLPDGEGAAAGLPSGRIISSDELPLTIDTRHATTTSDVILRAQPSDNRVIFSHPFGRDWREATNPNDFTTTFYSKDGVMWKATWTR